MAMTTVAGVGNNTASVASPAGAASLATLSPDDLLAYVGTVLTDVDGQMQDYMQLARDQKSRIEQERNLQNALRKIKNDNLNDKTKKHDTYDKRITYLKDMKGDLLAATADPAVRSAINAVFAKLGNPDATKGQALKMSDAALDDAIQSSVDRVANLNGNSEMMMMQLNSLMQRRSQVVQFASNVMAQLDRAQLGIIGNMRG
jgi:hypothetical protein